MLAALRAGGFLAPGAAPDLHPLTGGVSSDVFRLETKDGPVCVKRALEKLRHDAAYFKVLGSYPSAH